MDTITNSYIISKKEPLINSKILSRSDTILAYDNIYIYIYIYIYI